MKQQLTKFFIGIIVFSLLFPSATMAGIDELELPTIQSESAILIDAKSGAVLYEQEGNKQMYPASITKIVTAILAIEYGNLDELVTVSKRAREVDGTRVYLEEGEQVPLKKLIQGLMINSGNDAGVAIAEHISGSVEEFAEVMNDFATKKIGVKDTHFENPHGLFGEQHYSTAYDFSLITQYAIKNEVFREIMGTAELPWKGESWDTTIYNHHWMLREWPYEGVLGGKNGFIDQSGHTLVTAAEREDLTLIAVVLNATTKRMMYSDTEKLFDFGFDNFETLEAAPQTFKAESKDIFELETPLFYTARIGEDIEMEVNSDGELMIFGEDNRLIHSQVLEDPIKQLDKSKILESTRPMGERYNVISNPTFKWGYVVTAVLAITTISFIYFRLRRVKSV